MIPTSEEIQLAASASVAPDEPWEQLCNDEVLKTMAQLVRVTAAYSGGVTLSEIVMNSVITGIRFGMAIERNRNLTSMGRPQ